jgi:hypothetical protein
MIIISRRLSYRLPDDIMGLWDYPMETIRLRDPISNTGHETCDRSPRKRLKAQAVECATSRDPRFRFDLPGQVHTGTLCHNAFFFELDNKDNPGKNADAESPPRTQFTGSGEWTPTHTTTYLR